MRENHIMKILVKAVAPLADPAIVRCTSDADFLVYGATNGAGDCVIETRSTGASVEMHSPTFTVGGVANDLVIVLVQCIIDLQSISLLNLLGVSKTVEIGAA
jgi:hypothetical protein